MSESKTYLRNPDGSIRKVKQTMTETELIIDNLINRHIDIINSYESLPKTKTAPDKETLKYYNEYSKELREIELPIIKQKAIDLYSDLKGIYESGLLPEKYENEYFKFKNIIERWLFVKE